VAFVQSVAVDVEEFVAANFDSVRRALTVALNDPSRAEDLAQEAFAKAWRRWPAVSMMERPVAWVYVVAMNRVRREFRRELGREAAIREEPVSSLADHAHAVVTSVTLHTALAELAPRQRAAVVLRYLADLTVPEVAKAMGCAEGTVKSTLHSALSRLQVELTEKGEP
jgi:RNA polymerase sigma-70 factor (ECF subfamily)